MLGDKEYQRWLESLKVGDEVAYGQDFPYPDYAFSKVERISPNQRRITLESGKKFLGSGYEQATGKRKRYLLQPEEAKKLLATHKAQVQQRQKLVETRRELISQIERMDIEQLERIKAFLSSSQIVTISLNLTSSH